MKFNNIEELVEYTSNIKGKTFEEIDSEGLLENASLRQQKGLLGHVVETGFYKYPINNDSKADFEELGIELKVSGYVKNKNGSLRAKERLVLSKINFNEIINETFESSHVLGKCENMLIIWYEYDKEKEAKDFVITDYQLYDMKPDKKIFENDFKIIKGKVLEGRAHELSEGDTSYLGACTKARTSADRTTQPFSEIHPKPRAFSLKNAYMTSILRENVQNHSIIEISSTSSSSKQTTLIPQDIKAEYKTVDEYVIDKLISFFGKTQLRILEEITGKTYTEKIPKNINKLISNILIGKDEELPQIDKIFTKTSFVIKNLPIDKNGKARERMSFRTLQLSDFEDEWEDSFWKNYFEETTIITICYQEVNGSKNGYRILRDVKKITFDENDLDAFEKTFNQIKIAIEDHDVNLLPTATNGFRNLELQIAPKGNKGDDAYNNFFKQDKTKVCFMISKGVLNKKLKIKY
ncbi:MAG: DNA mismatch repair protein MutH [Methanobrevibacter thaueri]|nr:DNA mismatch repair protein MutH [Methanobrevibacter thaueri]